MPLNKQFLLVLVFLLFPVLVAVACTEGEEQHCVFGSDCNGTQKCVDGNWTACTPDANACTPGSTEQCNPVFGGLACPLVSGSRKCSECGDKWLECKAPPGIECCPGSTRECNEGKGCAGTQECVDGNWSDCTFEQVCEPFERRECVPTVNGVECPQITGKQKCNKCGSAWLECVVPSKVKCCPGQTRACDGSGEQECTDKGSWGLCFDGDSCQNVECPGGTTCSVPRCSMGKCILTTPKGCCTEDSNCASNQHCVDNNCVELECGECFYARVHECQPKKHGVCCNEHWNNRYDSCELDLNSVMRTVGSVDDERSQYFLAKGIAALKDGFLAKAEYYFKTAELAVSAYNSANDYNEEVQNKIDAVFLSMESAVEGQKFSEFKQYTRQLDKLLEQKSAVNPRPVDLNMSKKKTNEEKPPEIPWLLVALLAVALVFLVALFIVEFKKKKKTFFSQGAK